MQSGVFVALVSSALVMAAVGSSMSGPCTKPGFFAIDNTDIEFLACYRRQTGELVARYLKCHLDHKFDAAAGYCVPKIRSAAGGDDNVAEPTVPPRETTTPKDIEQPTVPTTSTTRDIQTPTIPTTTTTTKTTADPDIGPDVSTDNPTEETTEPPSTEETTESSTPEETTEPSTPEETTEPPTPEDTTEPPTPQDTTEPSTPEETTEASTPEETTESSTPEETTEPSTPEETTAPPTPEETTEPSTPEETTEPSTPEETTESSTPEGTTESSTPEETTEPSTPEETTESSTPEETTESSTPEETTEPSTPEQTTEPATTEVTTNTPGPYKCPTFGFFPQSGNCSRFILCAEIDDELVPISLECRPNLYYDPALGACSANYVCPIGRAAMANEFDCPMTGNFAYDGDCRKYWHCDWNAATQSYAIEVQQCKEGEVFSRFTKRCGGESLLTCLKRPIGSKYNRV